MHIYQDIHNYVHVIIIYLHVTGYHKLLVSLAIKEPTWISLVFVETI